MLLEEFLNEVCGPLIGVCVLSCILIFVLCAYIFSLIICRFYDSKILEDNSKTEDIVKQTIKDLKSKDYK